MTNRNLILFTLSLLTGLTIFQGCRGGSWEPETCQNGDCEYTFETSAEINIIEEDSLLGARAEVISGDNLVFTYQYVYADRKNVFDDEYSEIIIFEVAKEENTFSVSNADLQDIKAMYRQSCFCPSEIGLPFYKIIEGEISGKEISKKKWEVELDITVDIGFDTIYRSFTEEFILE